MNDLNNNIKTKPIPVNDFFNGFDKIQSNHVNHNKKDSKRVIELKVTMEMLWNSFKDKRSKPLYYVLRVLIDIISDFIEDNNIKRIILDYTKLLDYSEYLTKNESFRDDFYYVFCARFFTGKINRFFSGKYGEAIPDEYWISNKEFMDVYSNYINTIKPPDEQNYSKKYKDAMKTLKSHLGLVYTSKKFEENVFKKIEEQIYYEQLYKNELKRKRHEETNI
jgi:hypothetical protein